MPLPTLDNYLDDDEDPSLDTSGISEDAIIGDDPDATVVSKKTSPKADVEPVALKEPQLNRPEVTKVEAAESVASDDRVVLKEPDTDSSEVTDVVASDVADPYIPAVNPEFFNYPDGKPVSESFDDRRIDVMDPDGVMNTVDKVHDVEAFMRDAEASLNITHGSDNPDYPEWINKPDVWPPFITFPSRRDMQAIAKAESDGVMDDERKDRFNEHFEKLSILMQQRARQMDSWITAENEEIMKDEKKGLGIFRSYVNANVGDLRKERAKLDAEREEAMANGKLPPETASDPFYDIKWAVLLDPYASPDDPRFADVARWGHSVVTMLDGGSLRSSDEGMSVPIGDGGSAMAGKMAIMEAIERGWTTIEISGSEEFVKGAREAAIQAGMGAKITTRYGLVGRSKPEYIMPNPPKLAALITDKEVAAAAHDDLVAGEGQAPKSGNEGPIKGVSEQRQLTRPGQSPEGVPDAEAIVDSPFDDGDKSTDSEALRQIRDAEAEAAVESDMSPS